MWIRKIFKILVYIFAIIGFVLVCGYFAVKFKLTNTSGIIDRQSDFFQKATTTSPTWTSTEEWQTLKTAIIKDKSVLDRAAADSGVNSRLILSQLMVEQMRLFYSNREIFKQVFAPLKILGNQSQFSWGVMGLKQETAVNIEENLKNQSSPYYLGSKYEHLLDFTSENPDNERFERIVNEHDHYYSYLYAGLALNQLMTQWQKAGYPLSSRPEILSTLYNIGFQHSKPNANPQVGGAEIEINGSTYSFGGLAYDFYYSNELLVEFPR